jgi:hypothetical protein
MYASHFRLRSFDCFYLVKPHKVNQAPQQSDNLDDEDNNGLI